MTSRFPNKTMESGRKNRSKVRRLRLHLRYIDRVYLHSRKQGVWSTEISQHPRRRIGKPKVVTNRTRSNNAHVVSCDINHCVKSKSSTRQMTHDGRHLDKADALLQRDCLPAELVTCARILLSAMAPKIFWKTIWSVINARLLWMLGYGVWRYSLLQYLFKSVTGTNMCRCQW